MQDAAHTPLTRQARADSKHDSLYELNRRFLELLIVHDLWQPGGTRAGEEMRVRLTQMLPAQRVALANCPYALFDLRFQDEAYWRLRLSDNERWCVADAAVVELESANFVRLALFYAWHIAHAEKLSARVQLGMSESVVYAFRRTTLDRLPALAVAEVAHLSLKWGGYPAYWGSLTRAAAGEDGAALRRVQLYGLQLAAAARLHAP